MPSRQVLRSATALLLVLIALDLAAVHTCVLDSHLALGAAASSVAAPDSPDGSGHPRAALHPDHCFCHGLSTGADLSVVDEPFRKIGTVFETPPGHLLRLPSALDHPPQLPA
ncbi:MAG: hypothetical protein R6V57_15930 [Vicinamibacterales bacterium]